MDNLDRYSKYPDLSDLEGSNLKTYNLEIDCSFIILYPFILFRIKGLACKEPGPKERKGPPIQHSPLQHKTEAALSSAGELTGPSSLSQVTPSLLIASLGSDTSKYANLQKIIKTALCFILHDRTEEYPLCDNHLPSQSEVLASSPKHRRRKRSFIMIVSS